MRCKQVSFFFYFLFLIASSYSAEAVKLDYSNEGITDDAMAQTIKLTKPPAIKRDILDKMGERISSSSSGKKYTFQDITELDFSSNFLTSIGASEVITFLFENQHQFTHLKKVNLSFNRISEDDGYDFFEKNLLNFVARFPATKVELTGNYLSQQRLLRSSKLKFLESESLESSPHIIYRSDVIAN